MSANLVIVESPAKAKTIKKYLGSDFEVLASYGHVRDLIEKEGAVNPDRDFEMKYQLIDKSRPKLEAIERAMKKAGALYLATDPDREGEAISWHLSEILKEHGALDGKALRLLREAFPDTWAKVAVDITFEPGHVIPELAEGSVSVEQVSGGEREQIYLATRLALADVLARGERQLVVLDDVLTATDSGRLARVMGILEEAAQRLQVLVLTCHPERYRGLAGANFVDLEAIIRGAG